MKHPISPLLFASLLWFSVACGDATSDDLGSVNPSTGGSAGAAGNGLAGGAVAGAAGGPAGTGGDAGTAGAAGGGGTGGGTAGSGAGGDAGSGQGGAGGAICGGDFPAPDKTCASKQDCAWAMHTANCCGSEVAVGFNKNYAAQFGETEQAWDACLPGCGCAADPPSAEDGKMIGNGTVEVSCNAGQCETSVVASAGCCPAQGCPAGTQCAGGVKCEPPAQAGQCWTDQECADGATCEGASMCPCDAFCDEEDHPGVCKKNGLAPGECRGQPDCKSDELTCAPPGTSMGCGICMLPEYPCSSDAECTPLGATMICGISDPCVCGLGCVPGCTSDADCGEGEACGGDHHCSPKTCQNDGECTSNFACNGGTCQRRTCKSDDGCSGGYCVLGRCYTSAGVCLGPPPP